MVVSRRFFRAFSSGFPFRGGFILIGFACVFCHLPPDFLIVFSSPYFHIAIFPENRAPLAFP